MGLKRNLQRRELDLAVALAEMAKMPASDYVAMYQRVLSESRAWGNTTLRAKLYEMLSGWLVEPDEDGESEQEGAEWPESLAAAPATMVLSATEKRLAMRFGMDPARYNEIKTRLSASGALSHLRFGTAAAEPEEPEQTPVTASAPPATMTLSASERRAAKRCGTSEKDFAAMKAKLAAQGKLITCDPRYKTFKFKER
jgi:hypothetical protein